MPNGLERDVLEKQSLGSVHLYMEADKKARAEVGRVAAPFAYLLKAVEGIERAGESLDDFFGSCVHAANILHLAVSRRDLQTLALVAQRVQHATFARLSCAVDPNREILSPFELIMRDWDPNFSPLSLGILFSAMSLWRIQVSSAPDAPLEEEQAFGGFTCTRVEGSLYHRMLMIACKARNTAALGYLLERVIPSQRTINALAVATSTAGPEDKPFFSRLLARVVHRRYPNINSSNMQELGITTQAGYGITAISAVRGVLSKEEQSGLPYVEFSPAPVNVPQASNLFQQGLSGEEITFGLSAGTILPSTADACRSAGMRLLHMILNTCLCSEDARQKALYIALQYDIGHSFPGDPDIGGSVFHIILDSVSFAYTAAEGDAVAHARCELLMRLLPRKDLKPLLQSLDTSRRTPMQYAMGRRFERTAALLREIYASASVEGVDEDSDYSSADEGRSSSGDKPRAPSTLPVDSVPPSGKGDTCSEDEDTDVIVRGTQEESEEEATSVGEKSVEKFRGEFVGRSAAQALASGFNPETVAQAVTLGVITDIGDPSTGVVDVLLRHGCGIPGLAHILADARCRGYVNLTNGWNIVHSIVALAEPQEEVETMLSYALGCLSMDDMLSALNATDVNGQTPADLARASGLKAALQWINEFISSQYSLEEEPEAEMKDTTAYVEMLRRKFLGLSAVQAFRRGDSPAQQIVQAINHGVITDMGDPTDAPHGELAFNLLASVLTHGGGTPAIRAVLANSAWMRRNADITCGGGSFMHTVVACTSDNKFEEVFNCALGVVGSDIMWKALCTHSYDRLTPLSLARSLGNKQKAVKIMGRFLLMKAPEFPKEPTGEIEKETSDDPVVDPVGALMEALRAEFGSTSAATALSDGFEPETVARAVRIGVITDIGDPTTDVIDTLLQHRCGSPGLARILADSRCRGYVNQTNGWNIMHSIVALAEPMCDLPELFQCAAQHLPSDEMCAALRATDVNGYTPADLAKMNGHREVFTMMKNFIDQNSEKEKEGPQGKKTSVQRATEKLEAEFQGLSAAQALRDGKIPLQRVMQALRLGAIKDMGDPKTSDINLIETVVASGGGTLGVCAVLNDPRWRQYVDPLGGDNFLHSLIKFAPTGQLKPMLQCAMNILPTEDMLKALVTPNQANITPLELAKAFNVPSALKLMQDFIEQHSEEKKTKAKAEKKTKAKAEKKTTEEAEKKTTEEEESLVGGLREKFVGLTAVQALEAGHPPEEVVKAIGLGVIQNMGVSADPALDLLAIVLQHRGGEPAVRAVLGDRRWRSYVSPVGQNCLHSIIRFAPAGQLESILQCAINMLPKEEILEALATSNQAGLTPVQLAKAFKVPETLKLMEGFIEQHSAEKKTKAEAEKKTTEEAEKKTTEEEESLVGRLKKKFLGLTAVQALEAGHRSIDVVKAIELGVIQDMGVSTDPTLDLLATVIQHRGGEPAVRAVLSDPRWSKYRNPVGQNFAHSLVLLTTPGDDFESLFNCAARAVGRKAMLQALNSQDRNNLTPLGAAQHFNLRNIVSLFKDFISGQKGEPTGEPAAELVEELRQDFKGLSVTEAFDAGYEPKRIVQAVKYGVVTDMGDPRSSEHHVVEEFLKHGGGETTAFRAVLSDPRWRGYISPLDGSTFLHLLVTTPDPLYTYDMFEAASGIVPAREMMAALRTADINGLTPAQLARRCHLEALSETMERFIIDHSAKEKPDTKVKKKPTEEVEKKPTGEVEKKPTEEVKKKPTEEVEKKPTGEVEKKATGEVEKKPEEPVATLIEELKRQFGDMSAAQALQDGFNPETIAQAVRRGAITNIGDPTTGVIESLLQHQCGSEGLVRILADPRCRSYVSADSLWNIMHLIVAVAEPMCDLPELFQCAAQHMSKAELCAALRAVDVNGQTAVEMAKNSGRLELLKLMRAFLMKDVVIEKTDAELEEKDTEEEKEDEEPVATTFEELKRQFGDMSAAQALQDGFNPETIAQAVRRGAITNIGDPTTGVIESLLRHQCGSEGLVRILADPRCRSYVSTDDMWNIMHLIAAVAEPVCDLPELFQCAAQHMSKAELCAALRDVDVNGQTAVEMAKNSGRLELLKLMRAFLMKAQEELVEGLRKDFGGVSAVAAFDAGCNPERIVQAVKYGVVTDMGDPRSSRYNIIEEFLKHKCGTAVFCAVLSDRRWLRYCDPQDESNFLHLLVAVADPEDTYDMFEAALGVVPEIEMMAALYTSDTNSLTPAQLARERGLEALSETMERFLTEHSAKKRTERTVEMLNRKFSGLSAVQALEAGHLIKEVVQAIYYGAIKELGDPSISSISLLKLMISELVHSDLLQTKLGDPRIFSRSLLESTISKLQERDHLQEDEIRDTVLRIVLSDLRWRRYIDRLESTNFLHLIAILTDPHRMKHVFMQVANIVPAGEILAALSATDSEGLTPINIAHRRNATATVRVMREFIAKHSGVRGLFKKTLDFFQKRTSSEEKDRMKEEGEVKVKKEKIRRDGEAPLPVVPTGAMRVQKVPYYHDVALETALLCVLALHATIVFSSSGFSFSNIKSNPAMCACFAFFCTSFLYLLLFMARAAISSSRDTVEVYHQDDDTHAGLDSSLGLADSVASIKSDRTVAVVPLSSGCIGGVTNRVPVWRRAVAVLIASLGMLAVIAAGATSQIPFWQPGWQVAVIGGLLSLAYVWVIVCALFLFTERSVSLILPPIPSGSQFVLTSTELQSPEWAEGIVTTAPSTGVVTSTAPSTGVVTSTAPSTGVVTSTTPSTSVVTSTAPSTGVVTSTTPSTSVVTSTAPSTGVVTSTAPSTGVVTSTAPSTGVVTSTAPSTGVVTSTTPSTSVVTSTVSSVSGAVGGQQSQYHHQSH